MNLNEFTEEEIRGFGDALSLVMLIDKLKDSGGESLLRYIPSDYVEKLNLQIPENMRKLLSDVIRVFLEKGGVNREEAGELAAYIERAEEKGNKGMFEAAIESIIEAREEARKQGIALGHEQGREEGRETGWKEGQKQGRKEGLEAVAKNALTEGLSLEFVQKITGFDMETLKDLRARMSH